VTTALTHLEYRLVMVVDGVPIRGTLQRTEPVKEIKLGPSGRIESLVVEDESVKIQFMDLTKLSFVGVESVEVKN